MASTSTYPDDGRLPWQAVVLTLFPGVFPGPLGQSLAGRALEQGRWQLELIDIRDHATDRHRTVDGPPFGGGAGMVLRPDVVSQALQKAVTMAPADTPKLYFSPRGKPLDQRQVRELAAGPGAIMVCGRYEGLDQRIIDAAGLTEVSIGDFVLAGGELPAMVLLDAVIRLLPGVMGNTASSMEESFADGLLEYPLYTAPRDWQGMGVPEVLLGGNHAAIAAWRQQQAEAITRDRRPDLWQAREKQNALPKTNKGRTTPKG